jgi:hypothetical protein
MAMTPRQAHVAQSVRVACSCARCGATGEELHVQSCVGEALRYSISFECTACGARLEADGEAPDATIRGALLDAGGKWEVRCPGDPSNKLVVAYFLVAERGVARPVAVQLAKSPSESLATGTEPEMACVEAQLAALGVSAARRRLPR